MRALRFPLGLAFSLAVLGALGCGGSQSPSAQENTPYDSDVDHVAILTENIESLDETLDETLPDPLLVESAEPQVCEEACNLCFNVCDLSARICDIAVRNPESGLLFDRCVDARVRCKRGTRDTDAVCDCSQVDLRIRT